jgi:hypothetical protein
MKRIALVISLLTLTCNVLKAQQQYFIFVWADNQQPFYARLEERTYSSSPIGHLVISQLKDSTYSLVVGFPKNQFPEQAFVISFNKKDLDYQLKYSAGSGWTLFNAQTSEMVKPRQDYAVKNTMAPLGERKTGSFATLMSGLVNDSAVLYKSVAKADIPKPAAVAAVSTDTPAIAKEQPIKTDSVIAIAPAKDSAQAEKNILAAATDPLKKDSLPASLAVAPINTAGAAKDGALAASARDSSLVSATENKTPAPLSAIVQVQEWGNDKGKGFIYYDSTAAGTDTVAIMIDFDKNAGLATPEQIIAAPAKADPIKSAPLTPDTAVAQKELPAVKDSTQKPAQVVAKITPDTPAVTTAPVTSAVALPDSTAKKTAKTMETKASPDSTTVVATVKPDPIPNKTDSTKADQASSKKPILLMNSDCTNFASEFDVDKLRVKMLSAGSVDDKVAAAKKVFKTKCFVTRYIRGLSELFSNDEDRFKFFDAAYPYVSDTGNFRQLLDLFTDELYIARFKALVRM